MSPEVRSAYVGRVSVAVVTDSTTYVPAEMLDALGVCRVDLYVGWDDDMQPESSWADLDEFYRRLTAAERPPTTSQPSVGDFTDAYGPLLDQGRDIVSVHIAAGLSGTCESAHEAVRALDAEDRITVVDGRTGAGGLGCLVIAAAEAARDGASAAEVAEAIEHAHSQLDIWFCLDTLEFLRKGGRIGAAQALLGSALRIKPVLTFGTEIAPVGKVRTSRRALERMEAYLEELHQRGATDWIVQHAQAADDAAHLVATGRAIFGTQPLFCTEVGPVLGAHLGRGMLVGGMTRG